MDSLMFTSTAITVRQAESVLADIVLHTFDPAAVMVSSPSPLKSLAKVPCSHGEIQFDFFESHSYIEHLPESSGKKFLYGITFVSRQ